MKTVLLSQTVIFSVLFVVVLALAGALTSRHYIQIDMTTGARNSLSQASVDLLVQLESPVFIKAFVSKNKRLRDLVDIFLKQYQQVKPDIYFQLIDPAMEPTLARKYKISTDVTFVIEYEGRTEKIVSIEEQTITNALFQLAQKDNQWILFYDGHGERKPLSKANHDFSQFVNELKLKGINISRFNLVESQLVPDNAKLTVIASPQLNWLPEEINLILKDLEQGRNLLWLVDPGEHFFGLEKLAKMLNITFLKGTVVDATSQKMGVQNPSFTVITKYPKHLITDKFESITLFPQSVAMKFQNKDWAVAPILETQQRSWTETGEITGEIRFDANEGETAGPLVIGLALQRQLNINQASVNQRIVVLGDSDFLSNQYVGNAGNLNFGMNVMQWLLQNDKLINIPAKVAPDQALVLSTQAKLFIGLFFLLIMPLLLLIAGGIVWYKRRR